MSLANLALAEEKKPAEGPRAEPKGTPVELAITGKTTKYTLDIGDMSSADYRKSIEAAQKDGGKPIAAPKIELVATLKNTSDKPISIWVEGDPVVMMLELKGEGAVNNITTSKFFTREFRGPKPVEIAPGKTAEIPLKSLEYGFRNRSTASYWSTPGDYELIAKLKTGVQPIPEGAKEQDGFGIVTLTSAPFKVTVEAKK